MAVAVRVVPTTDARSDHALVAAVRRGDDGAFETLFERYGRRITAFAYGMVGDWARAEDVAQDVFISALRRMRETERPIAFKPWIYEIAKNACIDQFRRTRRAEEISYDADERMAPADLGRLADTGPVPEVAAENKQQLDDLVGAFGGLSRSHHDILVLRELEGLTYHQIGERMGLSRPSVESTLFRARRRLGEEYDDLTTGRRCERVRSTIAALGDEPLGVRDRGRVSRHLAHCQPCRRHAVRAGVPAELFERPSTRTRVAALLPFPFLLRHHTGSGSSGAHAGGAATSSHLPAIANVAASGDPAGLWSKAAAAGLTIMVAAGASVATHAIIGSAPAQRGAPTTGAPVVPASDHLRSGAGAERRPGRRVLRSAGHTSRPPHGTGAKHHGAEAGHTRSLESGSYSAAGSVVHVSSTLRSTAPPAGRGGAATASDNARSYPAPSVSGSRLLGAGTVAGQVGALQLVGGQTLRSAHTGSSARRLRHLLELDSTQSPPQRAKRQSQPARRAS
jgi:RNA polymerase sigma factor (sigma-70 family)